MAKKTVTLSDLSGDPEAVPTFIALDHARTTLDLTEAERAALAETLRPYLSVGQTTGRASRNGTPKAARNGNGKTKVKAVATTASTAEIRAWAAQAGIDVPARGRLNASVVEAYNRR